MYKKITDPDFIDDIQKRREYVSLKISREILDKEPLSFLSDNDDEELKKIISELMIKTSNQLLVGNLMNPNTIIKRVLLKWSTGIGKTIGSLIVATSMIKIYEKLQISNVLSVEEIPNIFVVGNTRERIMEDLIKFPEFGFASLSELEEQDRLNKIALTGDINAIIKSKDHYIMLKRRITNKMRGGYFRFFGYQELVNRFFGISKDDNSISDLISELYDPDPVILRQRIQKALSDKLLTVNLILLREFKNSLLIVDESHNLYNSINMNSWGTVIQYIIDNAENLRVIFMTATPATNSVDEYIHVMNLINEPHEFERLRKGANIHQEIKKRLIGRVSFLQDSDIREYPKRIFMGETLENIHYLKFTKCPISDLQKKAIEEYNKASTDKDLNATNDGFVRDKDDYYIRDIALPNPDGGTPLYRAKESKVKILNAPDVWKKENKINVLEGKFTGSFLKYENIGKYSGKYHKLLENLFKTPGSEKIVIFHNFVKMSGVYMLAELLRENGYIDFDSSPSDDTICLKCNKINKEHNKIKDHDFAASKFGVVHSDQPSYVNQRVFKTFNSFENLQGEHMRILIGAQMIRESVDLKAVRYFNILSMPINIPTFLQIIGRGIRKGSHRGLPKEDRNCKIYIYISPMEEEFYKKKVNEYIEIQEADKIVHANAVDAAIHRDIIMSPDVLAEYGLPGDKPKDILGTLYYEPANKNIAKIPSDETYYIYQYQTSEIDILLILLRRIFYLKPVWKLDELFNEIKNSPFKIEIGPEYITMDNLVISLNKLMIAMNVKEEGNWGIVQRGEYFIKMPKIKRDANSLIISVPDASVFGTGLILPIKKELKNITNLEILVSQKIEKIKDMLKNKKNKLELIDIFSNIEISIIDGIGERLITNFKKSDEELLKMFEFFNLLITNSEVSKEFRQDKKYIGFLSSNGPKIYTNEWKKLNKTSAEIKKINAEEQKPYIGFLEELITGKMVFKIRKTLKELEEDIAHIKNNDLRSIDRGIVCNTKSKEEIFQILKLINRRYELGLDDLSEISVKSTCNYLRQQLILADAFLGGRYRTFYWYHEKLPEPSRVLKI
jgi:superfamily II DNA or RNA helicase